MPSDVVDAGDYLANARALEAAGAGLITLDGEAPDRWVLLGAIAAVTERVQLLADGSEPESLRALSRGRLVADSGESWVEVDVPADRASWVAMLEDQESAGATGVIIPWDPRLIDLLRNPDPDDRSDLLIATG